MKWRLPAYLGLAALLALSPKQEQAPPTWQPRLIQPRMITLEDTLEPLVVETPPEEPKIVPEGEPEHPDLKIKDYEPKLKLGDAKDYLTKHHNFLLNLIRTHSIDGNSPDSPLVPLHNLEGVIMPLYYALSAVLTDNSARKIADESEGNIIGGNPDFHIAYSVEDADLKVIFEVVSNPYRQHIDINIENTGIR